MKNVTAFFITASAFRSVNFTDAFYGQHDAEKNIALRDMISDRGYEAVANFNLIGNETYGSLFAVTQNIEDNWTMGQEAREMDAVRKLRSSMVGDIFMVRDEHGAKAYAIRSVGYWELSPELTNQLLSIL